MTLLDRLRREKKFILGMALGGTLMGIGHIQKNAQPTDDPKAKIEYQTNNSEIDQGISYLDEYVKAVASGKDKKEAYRELSLKMANGDTQKISRVQNLLDNVQKEDLLLFSFLLSALLISSYSFRFNFEAKKEKENSKDEDGPYKRSKIGFYSKDHD